MSLDGLSAAAPPVSPALAFASPTLEAAIVAPATVADPAALAAAFECCLPRPLGAMIAPAPRVTHA